MKIYRAVKTNKITQKFGKENTIPAIMHWYKEMGMIGHNGWDFACKFGEKVYWDVDTRGRVIESIIDAKAGFGVVIVSRDKDGQYYKHIFWHNLCNAVRVGQIVETGDLIALGDSTGKATGPHVHRGLKKCNSQYKTLNWHNGYRGAIDLTPFYEDIFVLDKMRELLRKKSLIERMIWEIKKKIEALKNQRSKLLK